MLRTSILQPTPYLSNPKGWKAESAWLAVLQRTVCPRKWSLISCRSSAGQGKFAGQIPTFYRCTTQPTKIKGQDRNVTWSVWAVLAQCCTCVIRGRRVHTVFVFIVFLSFTRYYNLNKAACHWCLVNIVCNHFHYHRMNAGHSLYQIRIVSTWTWSYFDACVYILYFYVHLRV